MCIPCTNCFVIGTLTFHRTVDTPSGALAPPQKLLCPACATVKDAIYRQGRNWCGLCFIPCIPMGSSTPVLACGNCYFVFSPSIQQRTCPGCQVISISKLPHCGNCGHRLSG